MKPLLLATALATVSFSASGIAEARDNHRHDRHGHQQQKAERDYWKQREKAERRARKAYEKAVREDEKAYRRWARGQHLPVEYRQPRYYVQDYRSYGLAAPPAGYAYVHPDPRDDTYYMIELASGLITSILGD
ncbi:MAG TPA: RcnB family protein [Luteimonas sp.]